MSEFSSKDSLLHCSSSTTETMNYPDEVFLNAAKIFQGIHRKKPPDRTLVNYGSDIEHSAPEFKDERSQRWSYELAFSALKYQDLLETILLVSGFYHSQPLPDEMTSLVVVMLYDFQFRKFQPRYLSNKDEVVEEVQEVETLLESYKTKLAAALAKCRIKYAAPTIEYILPETVRKQEQRASTLPIYAWINTTKASITEVFNTLKREGFTQTDCPSELDGYTYCVDHHCQDLLIFPAHFKEELFNMEMVVNYQLILQDKSHSLAAHSVTALLNMDDDIIVASPYPDYTIAHISVLTSQYSSNIYVCGVKSESREEEMLDLFRSMECRNIKMLKESFTDIDLTNPRLQKAKIILLMPLCSGSGVSDPVEFILNDHGDTSLLQDLSQGYVSADRLNDLAKHQLSELNHAMKFSKVQAIVYCTCSIYPEENENVISQALQMKLEGIKGQPYRISPPLIPLCSSKEVESASENFFKMEPSQISNGCFLAVLTREKDPSESFSAKDVLARAASKGLLDGIEVPKSSRREKKRSKATHKSSHGPSVTQAKINEFLNRENNVISPRIQQEPKNSSLMRKPTKLGAIPPNSATVKTTNGHAAISKMLERQPTIVRPKPEDKIVLKPVHIMLPPVMVPLYMTPPAVKIRSPVHYYHQRWHAGTRSTISVQSPYIPTLPKAPPPTVVRHPKPWH
ncbi:putative methyltransferase NSUN7 isoform X1 [Bufo bufo]|uniref:putative methyltransferase NSUN7 isoform X1 n=1 Tax=Bufo bufo TaxID=8384 RepID=UPI001ABDCF65|nr:putative methyltransferase NSUN7 isoform X1 [Bufo bufo]